MVRKLLYLIFFFLFFTTRNINLLLVVQESVAKKDRGGKIRTFPHKEGNYASFVFLSIPVMIRCFHPRNVFADALSVDQSKR